MGKSSSPPPPPDPNRVAQAQTQQNRDSALYNAMLNRVNTYTPLGSQEYSITGTDPTTGAPIYRQDINLTPEAQEIYDRQLRQDRELSGVGDQMLGHVASSYAQPFSFSGLPEAGQINSGSLPNLPTDYSELRQQSQDALYNRNTQYLDDQFGRGEDALRTRLANQGITEGSEAYTNAMKDFNMGREQAYSGARNDAIAGGGAEAERAFGISSAARGQRFGEEVTGANFQNDLRRQMMSEMLTGRNQPLNEFNALRGSTQVSMPQFQGMSTVGTNPADITSAINNQYQGNLDIYNARQQSRNSLIDGLFGLGGAAIMASDERVKEDIHEVGELNDGTNVYLFRYKGDDTPQVGVMAQEIEKRDPSAVVERKGVKHVDYAKVLSKALRAA